MDELTFPGGMTVFHHHRGECLFLYDEIFVRRCYASDGLRCAEQSGGCIFDVGANIGMAALFFHAQSPGKRIFAFEPSPAAFAVLSANMRRFAVNAVVCDCALAACPGVATFTHYPHKSTMSGLFADPAVDRLASRTYMINEGCPPDVADFILRSAFTAEQFQCKVETVSSIIDANAVDGIDLLKIDVEKAELEVLRGIRQEHWPLIEQVVAEVHDIDGRVAAVTALLDRHGFTWQVEQDSTLAGTDIYEVIALR